MSRLCQTIHGAVNWRFSDSCCSSFHVQRALNEAGKPPNGWHQPNNRECRQKRENEVQPVLIEVDQNKIDGCAGKKEHLTFMRCRRKGKEKRFQRPCEGLIGTNR